MKSQEKTRTEEQSQPKQKIKKKTNPEVTQKHEQHPPNINPQQ